MGLSDVVGQKIKISQDFEEYMQFFDHLGSSGSFATQLENPSLRREGYMIMRSHI